MLQRLPHLRPDQPLRNSDGRIGRARRWRTKPRAALHQTLLAQRLVRLHRRAAGTELLGVTPRALGSRTGVSVNEVAGLDPLEPMSFKELGVLCFQQSSGYSASPEVDVPLASETGFWSVTSAIWRRPPGRSTR
jgi:hypothetical protein